MTEEFRIWRDGTDKNKAEFEAAKNSIPYSEWKEGTRLINWRSGKCTVRGAEWNTASRMGYEVEFDDGHWGMASGNGAYKSID
jgi:hypothetical protein